MKILFLVERPTQFEAPFFRYVAARHPDHTLRALFTAPDPAAPAYDAELGRRVDWGIELLGDGYSHAELPAARRRQWLAGELRRESWDLLITNGYKGRDALVAAWLARRAGIATALRLDSVTSPSRPRRAAKRLLFAGVLGRLYDVFLGVGSRTIEFLEGCGIDEARRGLLPYAVDGDSFRAGSRISPDERAAERRRLGVAGAAGAKVVLAVAKLNDREAPWDLVEALPGLRAGVELVVAGDGPALAGLRARAEALAPGRAHFPGYVQYPRLPVLYGAADLFVHTARQEYWGVSVAEALACGLPAITSASVGAGLDLIRPGRNGFVYPAGDVAELAKHVNEALEWPRSEVARANEEILAGWDYAAAWRHLLAGAERARARAAERARAGAGGRRP
ncbi:MAG TPA: glycosyltransferase family 4 protein [Thermoanaerobaculia bacterium]|jgi:glycosyltransferase involved in cell wall biosynthesis|nr:glycosyltransferase family 4 protein [Thermoanaerobaculia bacterium]